DAGSARAYMYRTRHPDSPSYRTAPACPGRTRAHPQRVTARLRENPRRAQRGRSPRHLVCRSSLRSSLPHANAAPSQTFQACTGALSTTVRSSIGIWLSRTQAATNASWSLGGVVRAAFAPMGGVELRRYRAAVDLA